MIHYVHTKFRPILRGSLAHFVELIWNDPTVCCESACVRNATNTVTLSLKVCYCQLSSLQGQGE